MEISNLTLLIMIIIFIISIVINFKYYHNENIENKSEIRKLEKNINILLTERQHHRCYELLLHDIEDWEPRLHTEIPYVRCKHCYKTPEDIKIMKKIKEGKSNVN